MESVLRTPPYLNSLESNLIQNVTVLVLTSHFLLFTHHTLQTLLIQEAMDVLQCNLLLITFSYQLYHTILILVIHYSTAYGGLASLGSVGFKDNLKVCLLTDAYDDGCCVRPLGWSFI